VKVTETKGSYNFFIKYAYGQWMPKPYIGLRLGAQPVPYIEKYESAWGYRWVEKTPNDRVGWDSSADFALGALGEFPEGYGGYLVMVRNGEGYKNPDLDSGKAFHMDVRLTPIPGVAAGKGLQLLAGYRLTTVQAHLPIVHSHLFDGLISYQVMFTQDVGINLAGGFDWLSTDTAHASTVIGKIAHGWFTLNLPAGFALFERFDWYDPDARNDKETRGYRDEQFYELAGVSFNPVRGVDLALDYRGTFYAAKVLDDRGAEKTKPADHAVYFNAQFKF
jgi:hypothetical protein